MKEHRYLSDYIYRVKAVMKHKYGINVTEKSIRTVLTYFLKNILITLYNQIPITLRRYFSVYIYPENDVVKKKKNNSNK